MKTVQKMMMKAAKGMNEMEEGTGDKDVRKRALDWVLKIPPKDNVPPEVYAAAKDAHKKADEEVERLREEIKKHLPKDKGYLAREFHSAVRDEHRWSDTLREMQKDKCEILRIPRVGRDAEATAFIINLRKERVKEIEESRTEGGLQRPGYPDLWTQPEAIVLAHEWGKGVPDLAPESNGLGAVTGAVLVGADAFRGKCLDGCGWIDPGRAYHDFTPREMLSYAEDIERDTITHAKDSGWEKYLNEEPIQDESDSDAKWNVWIAMRAAEWLRFWAGHGFGVHAWF